MHITPFFDPSTATFSYIVHDPTSRDAVIIDPVLDYEPFGATISHASIERLFAFVRTHDLTVRLVLDTHVHADHMTGSYAVKEHFHVSNGIGAGFLSSQHYFSQFYGININDYAHAYDVLLDHNERIQAGSITVTALHVPGHTPSCTAYLIGNNLFSGDAIFQPTLGCGRADFPGGSATSLFHSIKDHIFSLPDDTIIWVGHDYPERPEGAQASTSVRDEKQLNRMITAATTLEEFVHNRESKDRTLGPPKLLLPSLQVNILGGQLPHADHDGRVMLRIPVSAKKS